MNITNDSDLRERDPSQLCEEELRCEESKTNAFETWRFKIVRKKCFVGIDLPWNETTIAICNENIRFRPVKNTPKPKRFRIARQLLFSYRNSPVTPTSHATRFRLARKRLTSDLLGRDSSWKKRSAFEIRRLRISLRKRLVTIPTCEEETWFRAAWKRFATTNQNAFETRRVRTTRQLCFF